MSQDKLQNGLLKLGSNPTRSVRFFILGLLLFVAAITLIYAGAIWHIWLQIAGIAVLIIALIVSIYGYIGIVSNRLASFRHHAFKNREKYKHLE